MDTQSSPDTKAEKEQESPKDNITQKEEVQQEDDQEDEETECGFCLFMKGGGCKDAFIAWEKCVEEADNKKEDIVEKCFEVTSLLKKCMDAHADYYEPILRAEKAMEEEAAQGSDREASSSSQEAKFVTEETRPAVPTVAQETPQMSSSEVPSLPKEEK